MLRLVRIVVALSGGVDSAVAAARLQRDGADVVAVHYRTGVVASDPASASAARSCCGAEDARDARAVAARLGVPFYVLDVADAFQRDVVGDFVAAYATGRTPNPCIVCNQTVKFGRLAERARGMGAEAVATGHYARTALRADGGVRLCRATDRRKDQSYVLYGLTQAQLALARFPLGDARKDEVRDEARALGLVVADKPDSQELCFVPTGDHRDVLAERAPGLLREGPVVDAQGHELGRHRGAAAYTVGQRRGLGIASTEPLHVTAVDPARDRVEVGPRAACLRRTVETAPLHWVGVAPEEGRRRSPWRVTVRIRHAHEPEPATLCVDERGGGVVRFDAPVFAPAPGQALVAYDGDDVLAGAPIERSAP
ncbi:MAG: tRNA 2-thiouridine(34) synthase MnmA [Planctomycetes bacterium]|nr:tRNA 2-thiouridine(34) synthase MnmA [Planctomycetota bacterium]